MVTEWETEWETSWETRSHPCRDKIPQSTARQSDRQSGKEGGRQGRISVVTRSDKALGGRVVDKVGDKLGIKKEDTKWETR